MAAILKFPSVHAMRAERWLGPCLESVLSPTRQFYYPIAVAGCPGRVWSHKGDLIGTLQAGQFGNFTEWAIAEGRRRVNAAARSRRLNMGFASFEDLINAGTYEGLMQTFPFVKGSASLVSAGRCSDLWFRATVPPAASTTVTAIPGGADVTNTHDAAMGQTNAPSGMTTHLTLFAGSTVPGGGLWSSLMLYDRIWNGGVATNTTGAQTVTMTPARYGGTGANGSSKGNFACMEVTVTVTALAHTWTLQYVDDNGNAAENTVANTAHATATAISELDMNGTGTPNQWAFPLNSGDLGISDLTQITLSATLAAGSVNLMLGHPLGLFPFPGTANEPVAYDLIHSAFNLQKIEDNAALAWMEMWKSGATAETYVGTLSMVSH